MIILRVDPRAAALPQHTAESLWLSVQLHNQIIAGGSGLQRSNNRSGAGKARGLPQCAAPKARNNDGDATLANE
jgi:hypothetical protein